jgi:hypothetical protein
MSRSRDISIMLGATEAANTSNAALASGIDSAFVAARALPGDWSTTTSGNNLVFTYADSNLIKFQDSGTIVSIQDIGAFGSI